MDITFKCDKCGQNMVIEERGAGETIECPKCQAKVIVPMATPLSGFQVINSEADDNLTKKCPFCAETIQKEVVVCPFCQRNLRAQSSEITSSPPTFRPPSSTTPTPKKGVSKGLVVLVVLALICFLTYFTTGFFVIEPIGAIPEGVTIWYWRLGTQMPFISSADGLLLEKQGSVSLLGRGVALATLAEPIKQRKIVSLPYSETLYLISTGGKKFER